MRKEASATAVSLGIVIEGRFTGSVMWWEKEDAHYGHRLGKRAECYVAVSAYR
jgi:hypothetical protein